jgi:hypothetical protein
MCELLAFVVITSSTETAAGDHRGASNVASWCAAAAEAT